MQYSKWFYKFQRYVNSGSYQKFIRDLQKTKSEFEIEQIHREIRLNYIDEVIEQNDIFQLGNLILCDDNSTILVENTDLLIEKIPTFIRLMVGNHGIYIEFEKPVGDYQYIQTNKDYVWYEQNLMKFYKQTNTVNYADYKIGLWYVSIYDVYQIPNSNIL